MKKAVLLNEKNIINYLKKQVFSALNFKIKRIISVKEILSFSNANYLFEADLITSRGEEKLILKQAQPYGKRAFRQGIKRYLNPSRVAGEVKMIKFLAKTWGKEYVPEILYYNRRDSVFLMADISLGKKLLIKEFDRNKVYPQLGEMLGRLLGRLHGRTYGIKKEFNPNPAWRNRLIASLVHNSFASGLKKYFSEKKVMKFIYSAERAKPAVIWGDPVHRNIYISGKAAAFFDFDFSCSYDPAFDTGILLSHWIWMMQKNDKQVRADCKKLIADYVKYYREAFLREKIGARKDLRVILKRALLWSALYLVSRTDGVSGSYFKDYPAWEKKVRAIGLDIFSGKFRTRNSRIVRDLFLK